MLSSHDSDALTRVGPGTPIGDMMRQYWIPAAMSSELEADGPPVRLLLLGEKLIAFRGSSGRVGIMDHRCPHRCASLFFGRNEEDGLRCVYHGWKFDVDGNCLDMPNLPPHQDFKDKISAKAYRVNEQNGLIWAYMGEVVDRNLEHLGPSDLMITQTRRRLLLAARALADDGVAPPGVEDPEVFLQARGGDMLIGKSDDWIEAYAQKKATLDNPTGRLQAAE